MSAHLFDIETAAQYGVNAAIMIRLFQFWIDKNRANKHNYRDDHTWTYISVKALGETFPYWTRGQLRVILDTLIKQGVILKGRFGGNGRNSANWYAFADEKAFTRNDKGIVKSSNSIAENHNTIVESSNSIAGNSNTIYRTDSKPKPVGLTDDLPDTNSKRAQEILDLDCQIAEQARFLTKHLNAVFRPGEASAAVLAGKVKLLVCLAQQDPTRISLFKDAVEWANIARVEGRKGGGIALFVAKANEATGVKRSPRLLNNIKPRCVAGT